MVKTEMYKDNDGRLLVIYKCLNGDVVGELFRDGVEKHGRTGIYDSRVKFVYQQREATTEEVLDYYGFPSDTKAYWKRW